MCQLISHSHLPPDKYTIASLNLVVWNYLHHLSTRTCTRTQLLFVWRPRPFYCSGWRGLAKKGAYLLSDQIMADILRAARAGDLSALRDAIKRGADVNSVEVSWFVGM